MSFLLLIARSVGGGGIVSLPRVPWCSRAREFLTAKADTALRLTSETRHMMTAHAMDADFVGTIIVGTITQGGEVVLSKLLQSVNLILTHTRS